MGEHYPTYISWSNMIQRCDNKKNPGYPNYGGRGISYSHRWIDFQNFLSDMGCRPPGMSLGRIDNDEDYCKSNCRWETRTEQNRNRRSIKMIKFRGETRPMWEWAKVLGVRYGTIKQQVHRHGKITVN